MFFLKHSALVLPLLLSLHAFALPPSSPTTKELYEKGRFEEALQLAERGADADFYRGLSLAKLNRNTEARDLFLNAQKRYPNDKRFPIELAGLAFQRKDSLDAIRNLRRALHLDPADEYANNFLASMYLLDGNIEASLKYWNRVGKPRLNQLLFEPALRTDAVLLDRAVTISPASLLQLADFQFTQARLAALQVFAATRWTLRPKPGGEFDLALHAVERNGFGESKLQAAVRLLRGLPYLTLYPEYFNIGGSAINVTSLVRWDPDKRRAAIGFSSPLRSRPALRFSLAGDVRDENWELLRGAASPVAFESTSFAVAARIDHTVSGRWNWGIGTALLHENVSQELGTNIFSKGYSLQYFARVQTQLLNLPEHRLSIASNLGQTFGRNFASPNSSFSRTQSSTELNWLPGKKAGDYEFVARLSGGYSWGTLPFSDLFMLGLERDNNLLLRGHVGTRDGRKGSAPIAQAFLLGNTEFTRRIFSNGLIDIKLGPFLDIAKPYRTLQVSDSRSWLYDPGIALKIRVLGAANVTFTYGRNTDENRNAFYVSALQ